MDVTVDTAQAAFSQAPSLSQPAQRVRIGNGAFSVLFVLEALIIAALCVAALVWFAPGQVPLARTADYNVVRDAARARLSGTVPDPMIELAPGVTARSSNLRGFALNGVTYYYHIDGRTGFDPLSRGAVAADAVEVVLTDTSGPAPLTIYRIKP